MVVLKRHGLPSEKERGHIEEILTKLIPGWSFRGYMTSIKDHWHEHIVFRLAEWWWQSQETHFIREGFGSAKNVNWELFQHLLPQPGSRILDVGCNSGHVVIKLREMSYDAYGVDLPGVIQRALEYYFPGMERYLLPCNLEFEELPSNSYDLVLCLGVMEHLQSWDKLLPKIARVLKEGGVCYLTTCNRQAIEKENWHAHHFLLEELLEMGQEVGLEMIDSKVVTTSLRATFKRKK